MVLFIANNNLTKYVLFRANGNFCRKELPYFDFCSFYSLCRNNGKFMLSEEFVCFIAQVYHVNCVSALNGSLF